MTLSPNKAKPNKTVAGYGVTSCDPSIWEAKAEELIATGLRSAWSTIVSARSPWATKPRRPCLKTNWKKKNNNTRRGASAEFYAVECYYQIDIFIL